MLILSSDAEFSPKTFLKQCLSVGGLLILNSGAIIQGTVKRKTLLRMIL